MRKRNVPGAALQRRIPQRLVAKRPRCGGKPGRSPRRMHVSPQETGSERCSQGLDVRRVRVGILPEVVMHMHRDDRRRRR